MKEPSKCVTINTSTHQPNIIPEKQVKIQYRKQFSLFILSNKFIFKHFITNFSILSKCSSRLGLFSLLLSCVFPCYGLSATTAKTIQGKTPYLVLSDGTLVTSLNQLVGLSMPDGTGGRVQINSTQTAVIKVPLGTKHVDIIAMITADGIPHNITGVNVDDIDGDADNNGGYVTGTMTATWKSGSRVVTDLNETFSICGGPYTLAIEATNVSANTIYGDPNTYSYGSRPAKTYTFIVDGQKICYIQPGSMVVHPIVGGEAQNSKYPITGYNPLLWEEKRGFAIDKMDTAGKTFPTTGFNQATFTLIGAGTDQSGYSCELSNPGDPISLSTTSGRGTNCTITFNTPTKPISPITINMKSTFGGSSTIIDSYTIPVPMFWMNPKRNEPAPYNTFSDFSGTYQAAIFCGAPAGLSGISNQAIAGSYFIERARLTNVPSVNLQPGVWAGNPSERFARDIDGTFMGEWGNLIDGYTTSGFVGSVYVWTNMQQSATSQFIVFSNTGAVSSLSPTVSNIVLGCL